MMRCVPLSKNLLLALTLVLFPAFSFQLSHPHIRTKNTAFAESSPSLPRRASPALNSVATSALAALDGFFRTCPYTAAALTCGIKASAADMVAQKSGDSKQQTDLKRNIAFGLYGALYQGAMQVR